LSDPAWAASLETNACQQNDMAMAATKRPNAFLSPSSS
jgi:hypothetical protein